MPSGISRGDRTCGDMSPLCMGSCMTCAGVKVVDKEKLLSTNPFGDFYLISSKRMNSSLSSAYTDTNHASDAPHMTRYPEYKRLFFPSIRLHIECISM